MHRKLLSPIPSTSKECLLPTERCYEQSCRVSTEQPRLGMLPFRIRGGRLARQVCLGFLCDSTLKSVLTASTRLLVTLSDIVWRCLSLVFENR